MFFSLLAAISAPKEASQLIDFQKVFASSPLIYSILCFMSVSALAIWIYSLATIRPKEMIKEDFCEDVKEHLKNHNYQLAEEACKNQQGILSSLISSGLTSRNFGPQIMMDTIKSEGKRLSTPLWQRLALLNDIAIVAPMIGLLGTVIGMFYAFYDVNRTTESMNAFFDGLGIAVGTTVMGLVVSILAMLFSTTLKYRLVKTLSHLENKSLVLSSFIKQDPR